MTPTREAAKTRVLIVDDQALFRELLEHELTSLGYEVTTCGTPLQALKLAEQKHFEVACLDLDLRTELNGFDLAQEFNELEQPPAIVFLTVVADPAYFDPSAMASLKSFSYLLKSSLDGVDELTYAIDSAREGQFYIDESVIGIAQNNEHDLELSPQQLRVLRLAAGGKTNAAIAEEIGVTPGAVEKIFQRICAELDIAPGKGVNSRVACVTTYLKHALNS